MSFPTKFTTAIAVDTWDNHFRWRTGDELRDRTIDATWRRVASAVAGAEGKNAEEWEGRFVEAFQDWRIVPDPRLLKWAGTGVTSIRLDNPRATLNLGAFVIHPQASQACFDYETFCSTAALAVRFLDDAWLTYGGKPCTAAICVGMMGFANALAALGWSYVSEQACEFASMLAKVLSTECLRSSLNLMQERGVCQLDSQDCQAFRGSCRAPGSLLQHPRTTAIHSQHLIALFANNASDALDPVLESAWDLTSRWELPVQAYPVDMEQMLMQQIRLRGRFQPCIDAPIDYPLVYSGSALDPGVVQACKRFANQQHLPEPQFRRSEQAILS